MENFSVLLLLQYRLHPDTTSDSIKDFLRKKTVIFTEIYIFCQKIGNNLGLASFKISVVSSYFTADYNSKAQITSMYLRSVRNSNHSNIIIFCCFELFFFTILKVNFNGHHIQLLILLYKYNTGYFLTIYFEKQRSKWKK